MDGWIYIYIYIYVYTICIYTFKHNSGMYIYILYMCLHLDSFDDHKLSFWEAVSSLMGGLLTRTYWSSLQVTCQGQTIFLKWSSHLLLECTFTFYFPSPLSFPSTTEPARVRCIIHTTTLQTETGAGNRLGAVAPVSCLRKSHLNPSERGFLSLLLLFLQQLGGSGH